MPRYNATRRPPPPPLWPPHPRPAHPEPAAAPLGYKQRDGQPARCLAVPVPMALPQPGQPGPRLHMGPSRIHTQHGAGPWARSSEATRDCKRLPPSPWPSSHARCHVHMHICTMLNLGYDYHTFTGTNDRHGMHILILRCQHPHLRGRGRGS